MSLSQILSAARKTVAVARNHMIYVLGLSAVIALSSTICPAALHCGGNIALSSLLCGALMALFLKSAAIVTLFGLDYLREGSYSLGAMTRSQGIYVFISTMVLATAQLAIVSLLLPALVTVGNFAAACGITVLGWLIGIVAQSIYRKVRNQQASGVCPVRQGKRKPRSKSGG